MHFRLVRNLVTLYDFDWRNSPNRRVISTNSIAFGADYVKVVEGRPILSAAEMYAEESGCQQYIIYGDIGRGSLPARVLNNRSRLGNGVR